jgi:hypothetical protein
LKERNKEQLTQDIVGTDSTGLKSLLEIKDGNVTVEIGVSV